MAHAPRQILHIIDEQFKDIDREDEDALADSRRLMASIIQHVSVKLAANSSRQHNYRDEDVTQYIDTILIRGFVLQPTRLSDFEAFEDAQTLKRWNSLIAERVEASEFSTTKFKSKALRLQRSAIAQAKTLHDLRQAVNAMIGPLTLLREHQALLEATSPEQVALENEEATAYTESVLLELEAMKALAEERGRILNEVMAVYDEGLEDVVLLRNCEAAKKQHKLTDVQAAKMFGISRQKLNRLRAEITPS